MKKLLLLALGLSASAVAMESLDNHNHEKANNHNHEKANSPNSPNSLGLQQYKPKLHSKCFIINTGNDTNTQKDRTEIHNPLNKMAKKSFLKIDLNISTLDPRTGKFLNILRTLKNCRFKNLSINADSQIYNNLPAHAGFPQNRNEVHPRVQRSIPLPPLTFLLSLPKRLGGLDVQGLRPDHIKSIVNFIKRNGTPNVSIEAFFNELSNWTIANINKAKSIQDLKLTIDLGESEALNFTGKNNVIPFVNSHLKAFDLTVDGLWDCVKDRKERKVDEIAQRLRNLSRLEFFNLSSKRIAKFEDLILFLRSFRGLPESLEVIHLDLMYYRPADPFSGKTEKLKGQLSQFEKEYSAGKIDYQTVLTALKQSLNSSQKEAPFLKDLITLFKENKDYLAQCKADLEKSAAFLTKFLDLRSLEENLMQHKASLLMLGTTNDEMKDKDNYQVALSGKMQQDFSSVKRLFPDFLSTVDQKAVVQFLSQIQNVLWDNLNLKQITVKSHNFTQNEIEKIQSILAEKLTGKLKFA